MLSRPEVSVDYLSLLSVHRSLGIICYILKDAATTFQYSREFCDISHHLQVIYAVLQLLHGGTFHGFSQLLLLCGGSPTVELLGPKANALTETRALSLRKGVSENVCL